MHKPPPPVSLFSLSLHIRESHLPVRRWPSPRSEPAPPPLRGGIGTVVIVDDASVRGGGAGGGPERGRECQGEGWSPTLHLLDSKAAAEKRGRTGGLDGKAWRGGRTPPPGRWRWGVGRHPHREKKSSSDAHSCVPLHGSRDTERRNSALNERRELETIDLPSLVHFIPPLSSLFHIRFLAHHSPETAKAQTPKAQKAIPKTQTPSNCFLAHISS